LKIIDKNISHLNVGFFFAGLKRFWEAPRASQTAESELHSQSDSYTNETNCNNDDVDDDLIAFHSHLNNMFK
jgi:hypothetical protein